MNKFKDEIAVAIITCNREDFLRNAINSIDPDVVDKIYIVNSGAPLSSPLLAEVAPKALIIQCPRNPTVVGVAKNIALREMKKAGYKFLFMMEDDIILTNNDVFEVFINTAMDSGLWAGQLAYGTHGGAGGGNVTDDGAPIRRLTVQYTHTKVDMYKHGLQAFTLFHTNVLDHIGYMDERYINAAEHLDHYLAAYRRGLGCNYWYFPDIHDSFDYIMDQDKNHESSVIRKSPEFLKNFSQSWGIFKEKYGVFPHEVPDGTVADVQTRLDFIENNYSQKHLMTIGVDIAGQSDILGS